MNVNLIISSIALIFTPFLYILREDEKRYFRRFKSPIEKSIYVFFLVIAYILARSVFMIFYYMSASFVRNNYGFSETTTSIIVLGIDGLYWTMVGKIQLLKNEPILWRAIWFYFAEWFVITSLSVVIASILFFLLR